MRKLSAVGIGLLVAGGLTGCADPFANADLSLNVNGPAGIVGETVEVSVVVSGVEAEKVVVIQEQLDGGSWVDLQTFKLTKAEASASVTDVIDDYGSVVYRALLLPKADAAPVVETTSSKFSPVTLAEYLDQNLNLSLFVGNKPDESDYFFDQDVIGIDVSAELSGDVDLPVKITLTSSTGEVIGETDSFGSTQFDWNVATNSTTGESVELVLEAAVSAASGKESKSTTLTATLVNPIAAFNELAEATNQTGSLSVRRELMLAAAGEVFIDTTSKSYTDGLALNFVFDEPFLGEVVDYRPVERYEVPQACAPGGSASTVRLPGRPFVIEAELAGYDYNETIFGYFDGEKVLFSTIWKLCLG